MDLELGKTTKTKTPITISMKERKQGTYVIGTTGTGKSTFIKNIVYQDMTKDGKKHGICVLDPHGDLIDELLELVPDDRKDDVILFDPSDTDRPFGLNIIHFDRKYPDDKGRVVSNLIGTLERLTESWGPRLEHVLRHTLLTALTFPEATLYELGKLLYASEAEIEYLSEHLEDPLLRRFWRNFPKKSGSDREEFVASTQNKLTPFLMDDMMRNIIGQKENTIDFEKAMNDGKIIFINLSKGSIGENNSKLLGSVIVNEILLAALKRRDKPENDRKQFHLVVDEFQNFATESFAILQSEARKYGVDVLVAHQYRDQLELKSKGSTLNVGNMIIFRCTGRDSYELASQFNNEPPVALKDIDSVYSPYHYQGEEFMIKTELSSGEGGLYKEVDLPRRAYNDVEAEMANKLTAMPDWYAWCRLVRKPEKPNPPRLEEVRVLTEHMTEHLKNKEMAKYIKARSSAMGTPRAEVEEEILNRPFWNLSEIDQPADDFIAPSKNTKRGSKDTRRKKMDDKKRPRFKDRYNK